MSALLKIYMEVCLLSKGPQDIPYSVYLLRLMLALYFITGVLSILPMVSFGQSLWVMCLDLLILMVFCWIGLQLFKKLSRFNQLLTAILGTGSFFNLLAWPLINYFEVAKAQDVIIPELGFIFLVQISWKLAVYAHIFRETFGVRLYVAFLLTLSYAIISIISQQLIFPDLGA